MGTLFNQEPRNYRHCENTESYIENTIKLSKKYKITIDQVIAIEQLLECKRRNDLYVDNGDIHDEQMAGIGELLRNLVSVIEEKINIDPDYT
ncbi:hypothetical protein FJR38_00470 [Anabaena sp. UHCC 0253]|nr:hypothetical protein [Anabaena sp. UHCC 0253]